MAFYASTSWIRFVGTPSDSKLYTTTSFIARATSKRLFDSLNCRTYFSLQNLNPTEWLCGQIPPVGIMTSKLRRFVGVPEDLNCNEFKNCDMVAKKNTQISRLSVLDTVVCYYREMVYVIAIVAHHKNKINYFVGRYV